MQDVLIIGGGLAGLLNALQLAQAGRQVLLVEKKTYPFHRVCGEYVSNEVVPFLQRLGAYPEALAPAQIRQFLLSSPTGKTLRTQLPLGGFGISRYAFDDFLFRLAQQRGAQVLTGTSVQDVVFMPEADAFTVQISDGQTVQARLVIGAWGKRTQLDRQLQRPFFRQRSPYLGVKYHIRTDFPDDLIALHNFADGYCGISRIEDGKYCLCYLTTRNNLKRHGSIPEMEATVLQQNPHLKRLFTESDFLYEQPEVINEISFAPKQAVEAHVLMSGDAAGLITPLCGNGMAMAIHSAKLLAELVEQYFGQKESREWLEQQYRQVWQQQFSSRLWVGRTVQHLFGHPLLSEVAVQSLKQVPPLTRFIIRQTHGEVF